MLVVLAYDFNLTSGFVEVTVPLVVQGSNYSVVRKCPPNISIET